MPTKTRPAIRLIAASITWVDPPDGEDSPGEPGQVAYDESYLYICTATNHWRRIALGW